LAGSARSTTFDPELIKVALSLARRFGAPQWDVDDIAQEALLKFIASRDRIENPEAWLFLVIGRHVRRCADRPKTPQHGKSSIDPWRVVDLVLDTQRLLNGLSVRARRALLLSLAGFSERETAARLGCSIKATEKSLYRARQAVRKSLISIWRAFFYGLGRILPRQRSLISRRFLPSRQPTEGWRR
jgi:DNA-directed RNA polymerase specialized sigma24 family protein